MKYIKKAEEALSRLATDDMAYMAFFAVALSSICSIVLKINCSGSVSPMGVVVVVIYMELGILRKQKNTFVCMMTDHSLIPISGFWLLAACDFFSLDIKALANNQRPMAYIFGALGALTAVVCILRHRLEKK